MNLDDRCTEKRYSAYVEREDSMGLQLSCALCYPGTPGGCKCRPFAFQIFLVCKKISDEARNLFYSANPLEICYTSPKGLSPLLALTPHTITALSSLTLHMNTCTDQHSPDCRSWYERPACYCSCWAAGQDVPLGYWYPGTPTPHQPTQKDIRLIADLRSLCQYLRRHLTPGRLSLQFVCETRERDLAALVLETLQLLPELRECGIWLSTTYDEDLRKIGRAARLRLLGTPEHCIEPTFPLRKLPRETQLEVIRHAIMVSKGRAKSQFRLSPWHDFMPYDRSCPDMFGYSDCTSFDSDFRSRVSQGTRITGCTDGYCHCLVFPRQLLSVDRLMRMDVRMIMFGESNWVFRMDYTCSTESLYPQQTDILHQLRHITFDYTAIYHMSAESLYMAVGLTSWNELVDKMVSFLNVPFLTLELILPHPTHDMVKDVTDANHRVWETHTIILPQIAESFAKHHQEKKLKRLSISIDRDDCGVDGVDSRLSCPETNDSYFRKRELDWEQYLKQK